MRLSQRKGIIVISFFLLSLGIVALGQPARIGWLGAVAAVCGFSLFFCGLTATLSQRQRFWIGTLWFTTVQLIQLSWMTSIEFQGYYILVVYALLALGMGCQFGFLTRMIPEGKIPVLKILFLSAVWTLMEWLRLFFLCGFSWNPIGLGLSHFTSSMQLASVFGVFGLSFWVMMTNLLGVNVWRSQFQKTHIVSWVVIACIPYLFGMTHLQYHRGHSEFGSKTLDVALVQTAMLPSEKMPQANRISDFIPPLEQWRRILKSLKETQVSQWNFIVLPEAAVPLQSDLTLYPFDAVVELLISVFGPEVEHKFPPLIPPYAEVRELQGKPIWCISNLFLCQTLANLYGAEFVVGFDHTDQKTAKNYNSAFYLKPNSLTFERYDKQVLLPLAEYLPFDFLRPLTKSYGIYAFFSQGEGAKIFGDKTPFSPSICYEETFPNVMREGKVKGAELFINVTNDNYYPDSSLHKQHLFHARLRAVENGIPLIRACNSGVTAALDSFGQIQASLLPQEGVLNYRLTAYHYPTLFSFWGEWGLVGVCLIMICLDLGRVLRLAWMQNKSKLQESP